MDTKDRQKNRKDRKRDKTDWQNRKDRYTDKKDKQTDTKDRQLTEILKSHKLSRKFVVVTNKYYGGNISVSYY